jgi:hypothetical protein
MLSVITLSVTFCKCYAACRYDEYRYAECRYADYLHAECVQHISLLSKNFMLLRKKKVSYVWPGNTN